MNRHASRLVDNYHVVVFVDYTNRLRCDGGLMAVEGVGYYIAILNNGVDRGDSLTIDNDFTAFYGVFLSRLVQIHVCKARVHARNIQRVCPETLWRRCREVLSPAISPCSRYYRYNGMGIPCVGRLQDSMVEARDCRGWSQLLEVV